MVSAAFERTVTRLRFHPWLTAARRLDLGEADVQGRVWLPGGGRVQIGRGVRLIARRAEIELRAYEGAEIVIEDDVVIEDGTSIEATARVTIGARTRVGPFCKIIDNQFHHLTRRFERPPAVPVVIGPDSFIGAHAVVLPGASLGAGAWIEPAVVLSSPVPAGGRYPRERGVHC